MNARPIEAPVLGDDALAFELNAETSFAQYVLYVRRGGLMAGLTNIGQLPETDVTAVAAAIDRAMAQTR